VNWNWDPRTWRTATRLLLGLVTIWPLIYIALFVGVILSGLLYGVLDQRNKSKLARLDVIQLEKKIQNGEIIELRITGSEVEALDRHGRSYETYLTNTSARDELIRQARQLDSDNFPRVAQIEESSSTSPSAETVLPIGFALLFLAHITTMALMVLLLIFYIVMALKDERHDQTARIVWIVLIATAGVLADLVYWYLYIWRKPQLRVEPLSTAS